MAPGQDNKNVMDEEDQDRSTEGSSQHETETERKTSDLTVDSGDTAEIKEPASKDNSPKVSADGDGATEDKEVEKEKGEYDDEPDETLSERLWGLTEMFPEGVRNTTSIVVDQTVWGIKGLYSFSRTAFWVIFSSSIILFAPVMFEVERAQLEEMQRSQQKQMLLGPTSTVAGNTTGIPTLPPLHRPS